MGGLASRFGGEGEKGKEMGEGGKSVKRATKEAAKKAEKKTATKKKEMATKKSTKSFGCAFPWSYRKGGGARKAAKNWSDNTSSNQQMTDPSKRTSNERNNIEFFGEEDADHQNDEVLTFFFHYFKMKNFAIFREKSIRKA
jgi:hypothetical protein